MPPPYTETADSYLWTRRFTHCEYGYYVKLPPKVVAHAGRGEPRVSGFIVALPDVDTQKFITVIDRSRYISVFADPNAQEWKTLAEATVANLTLLKRRAEFRLLRRSFVRVDGVRFIRLKARFVEDGREQIEEWIFTLRGGYQYQLVLGTTPADYIADHHWFELIVRGFRFAPMYSCRTK